MKKKTKIPTVTTPVTPPPPTPRADIERMFIDYLTSQVERCKENLDEWRATFQAQLEPYLISHDLEWSLNIVEMSSKYKVYAYVLEALTKPDTKATMEYVTEFATEKALDHAKYPKRSSSPMLNLTHQCDTAAWANIAADLRQWAASIKHSDAYYAAQVPA